MKFERCSGLLLHITSLPGKYGIGTLGKEAYDFVDFLILSDQKIWQILPLGHTSFGDSPYQCFSAFAGNPLLLDLEKLADDGWLSAKDFKLAKPFRDDMVDFGPVIEWKYPILKKAYKNFMEKANKIQKSKYERFCTKHAHWLNDYTLFVAIKNHFKGMPWYMWPEDIKNREQSAMKFYLDNLKEEVDFYKVLQFFFFKQWYDLKAYANKNLIRIFGDIPLYVAHDSVDAWSHPESFQFDEHRNPTAVAGVPPDYFSETGQLWGNPLYDWDNLRETNFQWWVDRVRSNFELYDILRIDHFRGLAAYWAVPYGETTAINGEWIDAPGQEMIQALYNELGDLTIVAEDLGIITPDVEELRDNFGLPGMKILQFAFDTAEDHNFLPHTYEKNCIVYTGTHDNNTCRGWFDESCEEDKKKLREYFFNVDEKHISWSLIKLAWSTVASVAIAPLQDVLSLDAESRMNFPGKAEGNWAWRYLTGTLTEELAEELRKVTKIYER
jgi:4-alpha-glucanotransferase